MAKAGFVSKSSSSVEGVVGSLVRGVVVVFIVVVVVVGCGVVAVVVKIGGWLVGCGGS